jgi:hypothetical protein
MFYTDRPHFLNKVSEEKLIYPFGPPIFQTEAPKNVIKNLIDEGRKLTIKEDDNNFSLAGNLKYGRSFKYKNSFIEKEKKFFIEKANSFVDMLEKTDNVVLNKNFLLDSLWINFSKMHDFNPSHNHEGFISFVIYCSVPEEIFQENADSNFQNAGKIIFEYGEGISKETKTTYKVTPYNGLMFMFPSALRHFVPPYYVDKERISVSGNISYV